MSGTPAFDTDIGPNEMTAEQLALPSSRRVIAQTNHGDIEGGTTKDGVQVFLNVPYAQDGPRWSDPIPLDELYRYPKGSYIKDGLYCAQPRPEPDNTVREDLGLGGPTEHPFFADIYTPPTVRLPVQPQSGNLKPVHVFFHGGLLNFGSTSGLYNNQQSFACKAYDEVRVLLGYRLGLWGFLASERYGIEGNFGFKDAWAGLEWVKRNIAAFGGDPDRIHVSGLSGGAHVVHQILHYAARQSPKQAPFISAGLHSNAILSNPVPPSDKEEQVEALLGALDIDPDSPDVVRQLRDTEKISSHRMMRSVASLGKHSLFRGVAGKDGWFAPDLLDFQKSGKLGRGLKDAGVQVVIVGDVKDEVAYYSVAYPCQAVGDILPNLERFYPPEDSAKLLSVYPPIASDASPAECDQLQGRILADAQVHLPVRLLAKDLVKGGLPVLRYTVEYVAKSLGTNGLVVHGSDCLLHHYRLSAMTPDEAKVAWSLHQALDQAVKNAIEGSEPTAQGGHEVILTLSSDGEVEWKPDERWAQLRAVEAILRS